MVASPAIHQDSIGVLKEKGLSEDKIIEYQAAFQLFDGGGRGVIDVTTLGGLLNGTFGGSPPLGFPPPYRVAHSRGRRVLI